MKKLLLGLFLLTLSLTMVGCNNGEDNSLENILDKGKIVVGFTEFPPMGYEEKCKVIGFDIDLATQVANILGINVEFKYIDWNSKVFELESGRVDVIWNGMTITEERLNQMEFTKKYIDNNLIILTLKESNIETLQDLNNKTIGVESTSSGQIALEKNKNIFNSLKQMKEYDTSNSALLALESGAIDVMIVDEIYARYYVLNKSDKFKIGTEIVGVEEYGIGLLKGSIKLRNKIDELIDELALEGKVQEISNKWFNTNLYSR